MHKRQTQKSKNTFLILQQSTLQSAVVQYDSWNTGAGMVWIGTELVLEEGEEGEMAELKGRQQREMQGQNLTHAWRGWAARLHLWKFTVWRFESACRGLTVTNSWWHFDFFFLSAIHFVLNMSS